MLDTDQDDLMVGYIPWIRDLIKQSYEALEDLIKIFFGTLVGVV